MARKSTRKIDRIHQLFGLEPGRTCGECINLVCIQSGRRVRYKCMVYGCTSSEASDWDKSWTACRMFGHEYSGRSVIELQEQDKEPELPLEGQMSLLGDDIC